MQLYEIEPIDVSLVRKYHTLINKNLLEQELREINLYFIPNITIDFVQNLMTQSKPLPNVTIDGLQTYAFNIGVELGIILYDEDQQRITAFAGFQQAPHINSNLYQAKNAQSFSPFNVKALVSKIYKFCSEQLDMIIQSDIEQSTSAKKLWTKPLPGLGIHPKILDLQTNRIHKNNNGIEVYDNNRYCWLIDTHNYFQNQLAENSILKNNRVFIGSIGIKYCLTIC